MVIHVDWSARSTFSFCRRPNESHVVDLHRKYAWAVVRRALFVSVLLLIGVITVSVFHYAQTPNTPGLPPVGIFAWGMDSIGTVLAIWLVTRANIWRSCNGLLRVVTYIVAFAYGRMLFSATQDWLNPSEAIFRFPGSKLEDYARPALDLLSLMMFTWLLTPVVIFSEAALSHSDEESKRSGRFSIYGLIGFTTAAALAIVWIRFLTSNLAPQTAYSHLSPTDAIREWIGTYLPFTIPPLIAATVILYGLTKRWWLALLAFGCAVVLDGFGTGMVAFAVQNITGEQQGGILGGSHIDRWLYVCGRSLTTCCAFSTARLMGVRPIFGNCETQNIATEPSVAPKPRSRAI